MKMIRAALVLTAVLCLACAGCTDKERAAREKRLIGELKEQINTLKADKKAMEQTVDSLNQKIARLNLTIVRLEGAYEDLFEPKEKPSFWDSVDWVARQINLVILVLLVAWLFYFLHLRTRGGRR